MHWDLHPELYFHTERTYGTKFFVAVPETFCFIVSFQLILGTPSPNSTATYRIRISETGDFQSGLVTFESPAACDRSKLLQALSCRC